MLSIISVFFIFDILAHSWSDTKYNGDSIAKRCYQVSIIRHRSKIYTAGSAEDVYIVIIVQST